MKICGFQKMTLLDFPGYVACTVFTGGCNFRCPFCHNASLVTDVGKAEFSEDEIISYLEKRKGVLDGVCITGGEPLLQPDVEDFIKKIRAQGLKIKLDTNGTFPEKLEDLINKGLIDKVAMDIKNSPEKYGDTAGVENLDVEKINKSIGIIKNSGVDYEFRTTVIKEFHTVSDIEKIGEWLNGAKEYYLQNFVDSGNIIGNDLHEVGKDELEKMKKAVENRFGKVGIRGV